jgi:hypothetical protein
VKKEFGLDTKYLNLRNVGYIDALTNHIRQNRKVVRGNFNEITKVMHLVKIKQNMMQGMSVRQRAERERDSKIQKIQRDSTRWVDFRKRRGVIIDRYIRLLRKKTFAEQIIKMAKINQYLHKIV